MVDKKLWNEDWRRSDAFQYSGNCRSFYDTEIAVKYINQVLKIKPTDRILDAGCGNGCTMEEIYRYYSIYVTGVDISSEMIKMVEKRLAGMKGAETYCMKIDKLSFKDEVFDKVICMGVLQYYTNLVLARKAIQELYRVCKRGGYIYLGDLLDKQHQYSSDNMNAFLPEELGKDYKYMVRKAIYEPDRRYDMVFYK